MRDTKTTTQYRVETLKDARKYAAELKPLIQIGKNGITPTLIEELKKALKKKKLVKIKCLRYFLESIAQGETNKEKLSAVGLLFESSLNCKVIEKKGFTLTLWNQ